MPKSPAQTAYFTGLTHSERLACAFQADPSAAPMVLIEDRYAPTTERRTKMKILMIKMMGCVASCWLLIAACAIAQTQQSSSLGSLPPTYLGQREFYIPYQMNAQGKLLNPIATVQLLASRTGPHDWETLQEAEPHVQGFRYHAPEDGEYWFALRHLDRRGQPWPSAEVQPQMRIVVDTSKPELTLEGTLDGNGEVVIRYEARDANLQADTLLVEVLGIGKRWSALQLGKPDVMQPGRLVGRARWRPHSGAATVDIRASIADRVGSKAQASTTVRLIATQPPLEGPSLNAAGRRATGNGFSQTNPASQRTDPFQAGGRTTNRQLPSQDWPASNQLPTNTARQGEVGVPPQLNPYVSARRQANQNTPTQLIADSARQPRSESAQTGAQSLQVTPLSPDVPPSLLETTPWPSPTAKVGASQKLWSPPAERSEAEARVVNSRTFDIEYDLQSVGPWGVAKVELWGTADGGKTWRSFGIDPDNRSPVRASVPSGGTFGFRILVDGANSAGATPPQPGDEPELLVTVDLQPPAAKLVDAELGQGNLSDHLLVTWTAEDTNLEPRPIALFYSSYPNGPWSTIASGLENTGRYTWRIERHVPGRFYLRLEARDVAGNVATYQTPSPITLARPQPTGHLRGVRPITGDERP